MRKSQKVVFKEILLEISLTKDAESQEGLIAPKINIILKINVMKNAIKKIKMYLRKFKDEDGNEPDMVIIAGLFQLYTEAYIKMHKLEKRDNN